MEVIWKEVVVILNRCFTDAITYQDFLHRLWAGRGTGTASLEVKLLQQVTALREEVLHTIFLDLHKAYDALDRFRCLGILEVYGMVPRSLCLFQNYWERLKMVAWAGGYYGASFRGGIGVTQGDPLSPRIFNVVVDAVDCDWESLVEERKRRDSSSDEGDGAQTSGRMIQDQDNGRQRAEEKQQRLKVKTELFYAGDGMVASTDPGWIQS